jgi:hypothetical protein
MIKLRCRLPKTEVVKLGSANCHCGDNTENREVLVQEPVPREWIQQYVLLTLANGEEERVFLQRLVGGGFEVLSRISLPTGKKDASWAMDIREDRVVTKVYPWHSIHSVRLLQPEEREELQKQWRSVTNPDREEDDFT